MKAIIIIFFIFFCSALFSQEKTKENDSVTLHLDAAGMRNPNGIVLIAGGFYRHITEHGETKSFPTSYYQSGFQTMINPAYGSVGAHIEWKPLIFFKLRLEYDAYRFFGKYGALLAFDSKDSKYGDAVKKEREGEEAVANGHCFMAQPTIYGKIGPLLIINQTDFSRYILKKNGKYYLNQDYDTIQEDSDFIVENRLRFLFKVWSGNSGGSLMTGLFYQTTRAVNTEITRHRAGILFSLNPAERFSFIDSPRFFGMAGYNIKDRNREQELYLMTGLGFDWSLR